MYLVGNAPPGSRLDLDNVEFVRRDWRGAVVEVPVPPARGSETVGLSVLWDRDPDTVPPETLTHPVSPWLAGGTFRLRPPQRLREKGTVPSSPWYLHVRALDGAGNWGEAGHLKVEFGGR